jgi:hypothetical protein
MDAPGATPDDLVRARAALCTVRAHMKRRGWKSDKMMAAAGLRLEALLSCAMISKWVLERSDSNYCYARMSEAVFELAGIARDEWAAQPKRSLDAMTDEFESAIAPMYDDAVADKRIAEHPDLQFLAQVKAFRRATRLDVSARTENGRQIVVCHDDQPYEAPVRERFPDAMIEVLHYPYCRVWPPLSLRMSAIN